MIRPGLRTALAVGVALCAVAAPAWAPLLASVNDGKVRPANGAVQVANPARPDSVNVLDLSPTLPRVVAQAEAPASVVGPPLSVALTRDERLVPDNRLSAIDRQASPPRVVQARETGLGPDGVPVNRAGTLARVEAAGMVEVANQAAAVAHAAFTPSSRSRATRFAGWTGASRRRCGPTRCRCRRAGAGPRWATWGAATATPTPRA